MRSSRKKVAFDDSTASSLSLPLSPYFLEIEFHDYDVSFDAV